jgi:hypothetical protein
MDKKRPFQFSIKALLGITVLAAVVAWFAALKEPLSVIAVTAYLAIGLGQILAALALMARWTILEVRAQHQRYYRRACVLTYVNLILTIPIWLILVYIIIGHGNPPLTSQEGYIPLLLHIPALFTNGIGYMAYVRRLRERWLTVLWLLNLLNSVCVFGAVFVSLLLFGRLI